MTDEKTKARELKKFLSPIRSLENKALADHSFKKLKTYKDLLHYVGINATGSEYLFGDGQLDCLVSYNDIKNFFDSIASTKLYDFDHPNIEIPLPIEHEYEGIKFSPNGAAHKVEDDEYDHNTRPLKDEEMLPLSYKIKCKCFPFQDRAAKSIVDDIVSKHYTGVLLRAEVGTGKTFIIGRVIRHLIDTRFLEGCYSPWPIVYVTRCTVVEQTKRVLRDLFGINLLHQCHVMNIEQLRSEFGQMMVEEVMNIKSGQESFDYKWRRNVHPKAIFLDECQAVKNVDTIQSKILQAYCDLEGVLMVSFSATPFLRISESQVFCVSTHKSISFGVGKTRLTNFEWPMLAKKLAGSNEPEDYVEANVERLMEEFKDYVVDVKGVRPQFKALNRVEIIDFQTAEDKKFYLEAFDRYLEEKAKAEQCDDGRSARWMILVALLQFRKAAELIRAPYLAQAMYESVMAGKAAVCALNFKATIRKIVTILHDDYHVSRDDISLIWGGGKTAMTKRQKKKKQVTDNLEIMSVLKNVGIDMDDLNLGNVADYIEENDPEELRFGHQSSKERQSEIDKFQRGDSLYCLFTMKAGGVGLSLHHTDEQTEKKCRRKKNNFAVVEDIPSIPTRPRETFVAPTYSAIELVQSLGRAPRLTSLSHTSQTIVFFRDTVEERVAQIVNQKLKCLRKVNRTKESWEQVISGEVPADKYLIADKDLPIDPDDSGIIGESEGEE